MKKQKNREKPNIELVTHRVGTSVINRDSSDCNPDCLPYYDNCRPGCDPSYGACEPTYKYCRPTCNPSDP